MKKTPEAIQSLLKEVVDHYQAEDSATRERQIRTWRKLKMYWAGFQRVWFSEIAHDWQIWNQDQVEDVNDSSYYDKPVNVFKAYLESIIAALSINIPGVACVPDDPDNPLDVTTAKAGNKISKLVYKHNNVPLLWLHALYIYCTEGMIAAYSYSKEDESYGTYEQREYRKDTEEQYICPVCNERLADKVFTDLEKDEFNPDDEDSEIQGVIKQTPICTECGAMLDPALQKSPVIITRLVGVTRQPKSRQCIEAYGGLYVKVPNYAMNQAQCPYLIFSREEDINIVIEKYPHLKEKNFDYGKLRSGGNYDPYERWGRLSTQYMGEMPLNTVTIRTCWLRPAAFNEIKDEEDVALLKKKYPNGCKVVYINDEFAEACNESLDDHWTLAHNPLSDYLHYDPLGMMLTSVQDITNDLIALTLQTIEQGIPQTFADPAVFNADAYNQVEAAPGSVFVTKPVSATKSIAEAFYTLKTASLGSEVLPFAEKIQATGQLVSGALPSLFGGMAEAGSKTAAEYSMSRAQALQRLQTTWKTLTFWWKDIFSKVVPSYIKDVVEDERFVEKGPNGYVNMFIRKAELQGKIGDIELEAAENLPITLAQKKDVLMQLMQLNNPEILKALTSPENIEFIKEALGADEFVMPGEADRMKQYEEIQQLVASQPIVEPMVGPEGPIEQEIPSVEVDPIVDNHQVEADICRSWLISEIGRQVKLDNAPGYQNVLLHMKQHMDIIMRNQMQAEQQAAAATGKEEKVAQGEK